MDKLWTFSLASILLSVIQIQTVYSAVCNLSVGSLSATSMRVTWSSDSSATYYILKLRNLNASVADISLMQAASVGTERLVHGLRPGHYYEVTLKVVEHLTVVCTNIKISPTVPDRTQFTFSQAISSTSIKLEWDSEFGANRYILFVETSSTVVYNQSFTGLSTQLDGLTPRTSYTCYIHAANSAGWSASSTEKTITTLVQPPTGVTLVSTGRSTATVSWNPVNNVLFYQVTVSDNDNPSNAPVIKTVQDTTADIDHLDPCSTYTVGISSKNSFLVPGEAFNVTHTTSTIHSVTGVSQKYDCSIATVTMSWDLVFGATSYKAVAVDTTGMSRNCTTTSSSCHITMLKCGEKYQVQVIAISDDCSSSSNATMAFETVPCAPADPHIDYSCSSSSITFTWQLTNNTKHYVAKQVDETGDVIECKTPGRTCHFTRTGCGHTYNFTVFAVTSECNTDVTQPLSVQTAPCVPENIQTVTRCQDHSLFTSWQPAAGATSYYIEFRGNTKQEIYNCTTSNTSCVVTGVPCGEHLSVWAVASNDKCATREVFGTVAETGPCAPTNVTATVDCSQDSARISWIQSKGAIFYKAISQHADGTIRSCNSMMSSCVIRGLQCAQNYNASVIGTNLMCNSTMSNQVTFKTASCLPNNVVASRNCDNNSVLIMWQNHQPTGFYTATIEDPSGAQFICTSNTVNYCTINAPPCGKTYNGTVTNTGEQCNSTSAAFAIDSVPCGPGNVLANVSCNTGELTVSWSNYFPADNYTTVASRENDPPLYYYSTKTTSTLGGLVCGSSYMVTVFSVSGTCRSLPSAQVTVQSLPCPPTDIIAPHTCALTVPVSWMASDGAKYYKAVAESTGGHMSECTSNTTFCTVPDLHCGQTYSISVAGQDDNCLGQMSSTVYLQTVPCSPSILTSELDCNTGTGQLTWSASANAENYTVTASSYAGTLLWSRPDTSAMLSDLVCGQIYDICVNASNDTCVSNCSVSVTQHAAPCEPGSINATMDCEALSATIYWLPGLGATKYVAALQASSGHTASCTAIHTNCQPTVLQCGEEYNVTVTAVGTVCNTTAQMAGYLTTQPCTPIISSVQYNVSNATVLWSAANGATSYSVWAVTNQGLTASCNATGTMCYLTGMQCSQQYNVTVTAHNLACYNTVTSEAYSVTTEPCPPSNVEATVMCTEPLSASVWWEQVDHALGYVAYVDSPNGHSNSCTAASPLTYCTVPVMCGAVYSVRVKALGQQYNSSYSTTVSLTSAPCRPRNVEVTVDCYSEGAALVAWNTTYGTANFTLTAAVSGGLHTLCTTQHHYCNVTGLSCGETYNLSLSASNEQCTLTPPTHATLTTRPCRPKNLNVHLQCGSHTAVLSWERSPDAEWYTARAVMASGGDVETGTSIGSTYEFANLTCGETYNFTVTAHTQGCSSQPSSPAFIQSEPCTPENVSAQATCQNDTVQISWYQARGVENYLVTATGSLGYVEIYNTTQTHLSAPLPCGQDYEVTVQGRGADCHSNASSPAYFKTTPCVPQGVWADVQCEDSVGRVVWANSEGAEKYIAEVTRLDGHTFYCENDKPFCSWETLQCGEQYNVVVRAKDYNCTSLPSENTTIYMAPCRPMNLTGLVDCKTKEVNLTWDAGKGTDSYTIEATNGSARVTLTTPATFVSFPQFVCGQVYSLMVTPHKQNCTGRPSVPTAIQTWPCLPTGVSAMQDCQSGIFAVTWKPAAGADYYMAKLQTPTGLYYKCQSNSSQCSVSGVDCGYNFSVSVTASNPQCNATSDMEGSVQSVPCVPTNVSVELNCANNSAAVSWSASRGALKYSVNAWSSSGNVTCQSCGLTCSLLNLTCGTAYTVHVVAKDDSCSSNTSQPVIFNSAPCPPQNLKAQTNCSADVTMIYWDPVPEADYFLVSVEEGGSTTTLCNTTSTCSLRNVVCGRIFNVNATAVRGSCYSQSSQTLSVPSAPCQPQGIEGSIDCVTNSAWISWNAAAGADSYTVTAVGGENAPVSYTTSTNTTYEVPDLACGTLYNFSVVANNTQCPSQLSTTIGLETAPCTLASITASAQCHNSSISVNWALMEGSPGNTVYNVTAEDSDRTFLYCNSTSTICSLRGAKCDMRYAIIVAVSSDQCTSLRSPPYKISMEPCPPKNVMVNTTCEDDNALVRWSLSPVADAYDVVATDEHGYMRSCNSTSNNCTLTDLHCDRQYTVHVTASHENCSSEAGQNVTFKTGPCQPANLSVTYHCQNETAVLSWTPRGNPLEYFGSAWSDNGSMLYCHSMEPTCTISGLQCGTTYNFTVKASDGTCNSSFSDPTPAGAVSCPPDDLQVKLLPPDSGIQFLHFTWTKSTCSGVQYLLKLTGNLLGDMQTQFDLSSYWTDVTYFEMPLPCSSSYYASVQSRNGGGTSDPSETINGKTAPCPPSGARTTPNGSNYTVSWNSSVFANTYTVYDKNVTPRVELCSTQSLSCTVPPPATNLVVTASNAAGESAETVPTD